VYRLNKLARIAGLLVAVSLAGCSPSADIQQLNQNEFTLRGMIASDRQQIDALQGQVRRLQDEIAEMKHSAPAPAAESSADVNALNQRIARLESEMAATQAALPNVPAPNPAIPAAEGSAIPGAPAPSGTAPGIPPLATAPSAPAAAAPAKEPSPTWPDDVDQQLQATQNSKEPAAKIYREGLNAMKAGNYPIAIVRFAKVQHNYPKSPLAEPSEYFAANALYESGKFDQAILQFNDLVMRNPSGKYSTQALLRQAQAFMKLNDRIDARLTLQKLIADHAGTPEASAADSMIKSMATD